MKLALYRPEIIGAVPDNFFHQVSATDGLLNHAELAQSEMFTTLAALARKRKFTEFDTGIVRSVLVDPEEQYVEGSVGSWHIDGTHDLIVSDVAPTQFIYGGLRAVRDLLKITKSQQLIFDTVLTQELAEKMRDYDDQKLVENFDFRIWSPEPLEVVFSTGLNIHRAPRNTAKVPIERNTAILVTG